MSNQAEGMIIGDANYFAKQQCSIQWRVFLGALASELGQQIPVDELRMLMARLGMLMTKEIPTPAGETMDELEKSINAIWFEMNWGWVSLIEKANGLYIEHHVAPLKQAFGEEALIWSPAILEGIYAHWFSVISAGAALELTQAEQPEPNSSVLVFRFGRPQ